MTETPQNGKEPGLPFGLTRFLSWVSLVLILVSSLSLAAFIGNSARRTLLIRQQQYALLLAENLNHQIYRRFTLPTFLTFGRIALRKQVQYDRLDEVVQSTIHGLRVEHLRIYGADKVINYSIEPEELGTTGGIAPQAIEQAMQGGGPTFETVSAISLLRAMFRLSLPDRSFMLRTVFPLRVDLRPRVEGDDDAGVMTTGVLEIVRDISDDYDTVIRFQWLILATCLGSSAVLFGLLQFFILRAERTLVARMARTRKLEAELHQNEKLAGMGRVIASIAHEIRNPLGIIRSSAELLLRRTGETDAANRRILEAVYDESCRLSQTVNDFLDYARPRAPRRNPVDLNQVLDQALGFLDGELCRRNVEIVRHTEPLPVLGDKDLLYRAVYNVLSNALQAVESDGLIRIRGHVRDDGLAELTFHDNGPGFPEDALPRLLDPFFTTKDHGTGLGLPIVNTIVTGHGGRLELVNAPEGGAVLRLLLPARTEPDSSKART